MRLYLKENFRLLYPDGQLYDEYGNVVYRYSNITMMFPKIELYKDNQLVGYVKKRFTLFLREYDIYYDDVYIDTLFERFKFFTSELHLEKIGWTVKGDFFSWNYQIYDEKGNIMADVNQDIWHLTKRFYIDIFDEKNKESIILLMLAINQYDRDRDAAASGGASAGGNR